jgi:purine-cytosine permease-like protein
MLLIDAIGWIGSLLVVIAYSLNISKKLASDNLSYYLLNIIGSACLIANTVYHHAIPSAVVNIIWVLIAIAALVRQKQRPA